MKEKIYMKVMNRLVKMIETGEYAPGTRLPSETELAKRFRVNRHTLRKSLEILCRQGVLDRAPRRGTVVLCKPSPMDAEDVVNLSYVFLHSGGESVRDRVACLESLVAMFTQENPGITVEVCPVERRGPLFHPFLPASSEGGKTVIVKMDYVADYALEGLLLDLGGFSDLSDVVANLDGRLIRRTQNAEGRSRIHALPVQTVGWMMVANLTLLAKLGYSDKQIPSNWAEMIGFCREIHRKHSGAGIYPVDRELLYSVNQSVTRYLPFIFEHWGQKPFPSDRLPLDSDAVEAFLTRLRELYQYCGDRDPGTLSLFTENRAVFRLSATPAALVPDDGVQALRAYPFPLASKEGNRATVVHGAYAGILEHTVTSAAEKKAAWKFLRFLVSREAQIFALKALSDLPSRADLYPVVAGHSEGAATYYEYASRYGRPALDVPGNTMLHKIACQALIQGLSSHGDIRPILRDGQVLLDEYLDIQQGSSRPQIVDSMELM